MINDLYILCFSKLLCIVNKSSYEKEQLKLHQLLLGVKRGGGQKQPSEQPFLQNLAVTRGAKQGGGVGGVSTPPEFWMGGLNTCQPPLILRKKIVGGVGSP